MFRAFTFLDEKHARTFTHHKDAMNGVSKKSSVFASMWSVKDQCGCPSYPPSLLMREDDVAQLYNELGEKRA
jgi:hypothetical protein